MPYGMAGSAQYLFFFGANRTIWLIWRRINFGNLGTALGAGKRQRYGDFFQKHGDAFSLYRLPSSCGCLVFNRLYPTGTEVSLPDRAEIERIIADIRILAGNTHIEGTEHIRLNKMILWYSRTLVSHMGGNSENIGKENRVAVSGHILRAYISLCWNCKNCREDCEEIRDAVLSIYRNTIRGPCARSLNKAKGDFYEQSGKTVPAKHFTNSRNTRFQPNLTLLSSF